MLSRFAGGVLVLCLVGCETTLPKTPAMNTPNPAAFFTRDPDQAFRLSAAQRAAVHPSIDPDVLEALLARVRPEYREEMSRFLQEVPPGMADRKIFLGPIALKSGDPEIDALALRLRRTSPPAATHAAPR